MNFDEAFRHYKEGTATPEEKALVLDELAKAKALSALLDDEPVKVTPAPVAEADARALKTAKKQFKNNSVLIGLIAALSVLLIIGIILGSVFGVAVGCAKDNERYGREQCVTLAVDSAYDFVTDAANMSIFGIPLYSGSKDQLFVDDIDRDFHIESNLLNSYYTYKIEVRAGRMEVDVIVDTRNASCRIDKIDTH